MTNMRKTAASKSVLAGVFLVGAAVLAAGLPVVAMAQSAEPAAATRTIERKPGVFSGGPISSLTYTPSCGQFEVGIDAAAIQESTSRDFVASQARLFDTLQDRWDAYNDCVLENARVDFDLFVTRDADGTAKFGRVVEAGVKGPNDAMVAQFNAARDAAAANQPRIAEIAARRPARPERRRRGEEAPAAPPPEEGLPAVTWVAPADDARFEGTISAGPANTVTYTSGCPAYSVESSAEAFNTSQSPTHFNGLIDLLNTAPGKIQQASSCVSGQASDDANMIDDVINRGVDAFLRPQIEAYGIRRSAIQTQLNFHRQPGGLLAPPELRRPTPAPAPRRRPR
jgi:hypothetical protein